MATMKDFMSKRRLHHLLICCLIILCGSRLWQYVRPSNDYLVSSIMNNGNNSTLFVHVIRTRFMQYQPNMLNLGRARLALFETFCLPSILAQTNQNFLWVIRVDPNLHSELLTPMIHLLQGKPNFILLGSNDNPESFSRYELNKPFDEYLWAHEKQLKGRSAKFFNSSDAKATVFNGDINLLQQAYEETTAGGGIVLESRLDADDGLHPDFVNTIQMEAKKYLQGNDGHKNNNTSSGKDINYRIWCVDADLQWHPITPKQIVDQTLNKDQGYLFMHYNLGWPTPGLSMGFGPGVSQQLFSSHLHGHSKLAKENDKCTDSRQISCYGRLESLVPGAIRARTTTSAGMQNVISGEESVDRKVIDKINKKLKRGTNYSQDKLWGVFRGLSIETVKNTRQWIMEHQSEIAQDNLMGQCTPFFGRKNESTAILNIISKQGASTPTPQSNE